MKRPSASAPFLSSAETPPKSVAALGASGYAGADLVRLAVGHPRMEVSSLIGSSRVGEAIDDVLPHLRGYDLPSLTTLEDAEWEGIDVAFLALPHGASQEALSSIPDGVRVIDLSADFRLDDADVYAQWYGRPHVAPSLLKTSVYGLTEHFRESIASSRLTACPGCYPTATLMALLPPIQRGLLEVGSLIVDAKSGISGAGRGTSRHAMFCESGEGVSPYALEGHRHVPEMEQELSKAAGEEVLVTFVPHLAPMSRGELIVAYATLRDGRTFSSLEECLVERYRDEPFVDVLSSGRAPSTHEVRGSNYCRIGIFRGRSRGGVILCAAIDNLVKGSSGQAVQNFNVMFGFDEREGLSAPPLFP